MILFIYILFSLLNINNSWGNSLISFDFKIEKTNLNTKFEVYDVFLSKIDFCLGTPYQCIKVQFDPETGIMSFFSEEKFNETFHNISSYYFQKRLSTTYNLIYKLPGFYSTQKMVIGNLFTDNISFNSIEVQNKTIYLGEEWLNEVHYSSIGLSQLVHSAMEVPNFLSMLKSKEIIANNRFIIEFIDKDIGRITYDNYDINDNSKYKKAFSLSVKSDYVSCNYFDVHNLSLSINNDSNKLSSNFAAIFDETFKFISMPFFMKHLLTRNLFLDEAICTENYYILDRHHPYNRDLGITYYYYLCSKGSLPSDITDAELIFQMDQGKYFSLKYEDMFEEYDSDYVVLNILFKKGNKLFPEWIIGHPILKNYLIERDFDNHMYTLHNIIQSNIRESVVNRTKAIILSLVKTVSVLMIFGIFMGGLLLYKYKAKEFNK